jgi:imidazolonepropionase-like amidohydrolase
MLCDPRNTSSFWTGAGVRALPDLIVANVDVWSGDGAFLPAMDIVIADGRISALDHTAGTTYGDTPVIDGSGATAIPGLCDLHVHLTTNSDSDHVMDNAIYRATVSKPAKLLHGIRNGLRALQAGFTTLRVMGHRDVGEPDLRDFIDQGLLVGPRLVVAPWWVTMTGGHGDLLIPVAWPRQPWDTADGPDECRKMVRLQSKAGADFIKVMASGGLVSLGDKIHWPNFTRAELDALVDEAHDLDLKVAAHAYSAESIKRAVLAGVDTIEHGTFLDDECIELMLNRGTYLVPTLSIYDWVAKEGKNRGAREQFYGDVLRVRDQTLKTAERAFRSGIPIALGTDSSGTLCPAGENARELELYVDIGMSPEEALLTATRTAARALGLEDEIGRIGAGMKADLVVVNDDPRRDITILRRPGGIRAVIKAGINVTAPPPALKVV